MRTLMRYALIAVALMLAVVSGALGWVSYRSYFRYRHEIAAVLRAIPADELELPRSFQQAVRLVHPQGVRQVVIKRLFAAVRPGPLRTYVYTGNMLVWSVWFPLLHSEREVLACYAHTMVFEEGAGLTEAASRYFGKRPVDLTDDEALALVIMDLSAKHYSMRVHPDRLKDEMQKYKGGRRTRG